MKLNKYQKHYHYVFKLNRDLCYNRSYNKNRNFNMVYRSSTWGNCEKYYTFKRIPRILMNSINLKIHMEFELGTANLNANRVIKQGVVLKRIINNKTILFSFNSSCNKFDAYISNDKDENYIYEYDLAMLGNDYSIIINDTDEKILQHIDFSTEFTEEFLFQESLMHNYDLTLWQEAFNVLKVLNSIKEPTIAKIYAEFIKCQY